MNFYSKRNDKNGENYFEVMLTDQQLLSHPFLNKGLAFTQQEREEFGLLGFLPAEMTDLKEQCRRAYAAFLTKDNYLDKYIYLRSLQDTNEIVFYALLSQRLEEMLPVIYTPTIGIACQQFSDIYRYPRGVFLSYPDSKQLDTILSNANFDNVKTMVISDGEHIFGLGDQGAGGMEISIGKLSLYTLYGGLSPSHSLPILLDVGTDNRERLNDPRYLGWRHERIRGQDYDDFVEACVTAIQKRFPWVLIHWEDLMEHTSYHLVERYGDRLCMINGDIQGTAAITLSMILASLHVTQISLKEQRVVIAGTGPNACKIGEWLIRLMTLDGLSEQQARSQIFLVDSEKGLLLEETSGLMPYQQKLTQMKATIADWKLNHGNALMLDNVIHNVNPTVLIGLSGKPGLFTESMVRNMAARVARPVIFPLSDSQNTAEALPQQLLQWTNYRAVIATGSPSEPIMKKGKIHRIDYVNNNYILPGIALALMTTQTQHASDDLFLIAAKTLAEYSPAKKDSENNLLPSLTQIRSVSLKIAIAVAEHAITLGLADPVRGSLEEIIQNQMWSPVYVPYQKKLPHFASMPEETELVK